MTDRGKGAFLSWAKFLNPETLRDNLIAASIFLSAYEMLCASIIDQIRDFYSFGFDEDGAIVDEAYRNKVLALHKSRLQASMLWLRENSVISDADLDLLDAIRKHRNELAHELPKFISEDDANINIRLLGAICELVTKIDRWWIREVEVPTNPDFDGCDVRVEDILSGRMLFIQMMVQIASGEDSSAYWEEFQKQMAMIGSDEYVRP